MTANVDSQVRDREIPPGSHRSPGWWVIPAQECRDLWVGGRGLVLVVAVSVLLSVVTYLAATNQVLNFLEQREAVNLVLQVAVAVGVLSTLIVSADAISGERERGTFESLLLTPVPRRAIGLGKAAAALSRLRKGPRNVAWQGRRGAPAAGDGARRGRAEARLAAGRTHHRDRGQFSCSRASRHQARRCPTGDSHPAVRIDRRQPLPHRPVRAALQLLGGQLAEPALDQVEP